MEESNFESFGFARDCRDSMQNFIFKEVAVVIGSETDGGISPKADTEPRKSQNGDVKKTSMPDYLNPNYLQRQRRMRPPGWLEVVSVKSWPEFWQDYYARGLMCSPRSDDGERKGPWGDWGHNDETEAADSWATRYWACENEHALDASAPSDKPRVQQLVSEKLHHGVKPLPMVATTRFSKAASRSENDWVRIRRKYDRNAIPAAIRQMPKLKRHTSEGGTRDNWVAKLRRHELTQLQLQATQNKQAIQKPRFHVDDEDNIRSASYFFDNGGTNIVRKIERKFNQNVASRTKAASSSSVQKTPQRKRLPALNLRGGNQLFLKNLHGQTILIDTELSRTVKELKSQIYLLTKIPGEYQRLICSSRELREDDRCLADYGVVTGSHVWLLLRLRGGMQADDAQTLDVPEAVAAMRASSCEDVLSDSDKLLGAPNQLSDFPPVLAVEPLTQLVTEKLVPPPFESDEAALIAEDVLLELRQKGKPFKFPGSITSADLDLACLDIDENINFLTEKETLLYAQALLVHLRGDYLWLRAAKMLQNSAALSGSFWEQCCRARLLASKVSAWTDKEQTECLVLHACLRESVLPRLQDILRRAPSIATPLSFRGMCFPTAEARAAFVHELPEVMGMELESYTADLKKAIFFASPLQQANSTLHWHLERAGYMETSKRSYGLLCLFLDFHAVEVHKWRCTLTSEQELWLQRAPLEAVVFNSYEELVTNISKPMACSLSASEVGSAIKSFFESHQDVVQQVMIARRSLQLAPAADKATMNELEASVEEEIYASAGTQPSVSPTLAFAAVGRYAASPSTGCAFAVSSSEQVEGVRTATVLPPPSVQDAAPEDLLGCMPLRPLQGCQVDGALADEAMSQASIGTNDGHMGPPLNNWRTIYDYQDTGMVPRTVASLRSKSLVWTYAMLTRLGFPGITMRDKGRLDSDAKACHAVYHDGRCRNHCGDPSCTLRIKSTVFLPGHLQRKPGYALIKVFGAHPAGVTSGPPEVLVSGDASTAQASRPTRLSNLPSDLPHAFFDTHKRLGFANVTHALCHTSTAVQSLLLCEGFVNILRDMPSRCQQQMCLPCRLAEIDEFSAAPPSDANQRVVYSLLEPLGSWLLSRQLSPYGHNDASEVLGHLLSSIRAISVQLPDARHTVCTETAVKLTRLFLNQMQQTVQVEQLCDCGLPPETPIAVGQTRSCSTVGNFVLEVDISSASDDGAPSMQSLLDASFGPGVQNEGVLNFVRCSGCYNPTTNSVILREQSTLVQVAPLLVIGLQRYSFDRTTMEPKMNTMPVEVSRELKIHGYLYSLTSFAVLVTGPHWILYKRAAEDTWWLYDDSVVKGPLPFPSTARLATRFLTYERVTALAEERGEIGVSASPDQDASNGDAATRRKTRIGTKTRFVASKVSSDQMASSALGDGVVEAALPEDEVLPAAQMTPAEEAMLDDKKNWEGYLQECDEGLTTEASMPKAPLASDTNQGRLPDLLEAGTGISAGRSSDFMAAATGVAHRRSSETDDAPSVGYDPSSDDYNPAKLLQRASQSSKLLGEDTGFVPPSVEYNPPGLEMTPNSSMLRGEATGFADGRFCETAVEELPELDDRCDTATPHAREFSVTSSEQAGFLRSAAVPPPSVLHVKMVTSSTSTVPAVMTASANNAAPGDLLSCMPLRPLHRSFEPAAALGHNLTPLRADAVHASAIAAPADSSTRSREEAVPPISRRNEAQSEFARRFGALEPQYNPNFDAPPQLAATLEPVSLGLMPPQ